MPLKKKLAKDCITVLPQEAPTFEKGMNRKTKKGYKSRVTGLQYTNMLLLWPDVAVKY